MKLYTIIEGSAKTGLELQQSDGSMPSGQNGPWQDPQTAIRNTGHWLIQFAKAYEITNDERFLQATRDATSYLRSESARPYGFTFHHLNSNVRERCNGLVGQAWTIEALTVASETLNEPGLLDFAEDIFLLHPFDEKVGLWRPVEIDGQVLWFDMTFNHQLWFAAIGALLQSKLEKQSKISHQVATFMDMIEDHLSVNSSGLIHHTMNSKFPLRKGIHLLYKHPNPPLRSILNQINKSINSTSKGHSGRRIGYHSFNMYAFGLLYRVFPEHSFWKSADFRSTLSYISSIGYREDLEDNKYGYKYNPSGFEIAYTLQEFCMGSRATQERWVSVQLEKHHNFDRNLHDREAEDPDTLAARMYEATRLSNLSVNLTSKK